MRAIHEMLFVTLHPIKAIQTVISQSAVALEWRQPPQGSTIEEFPLLPLSHASHLLEGSRKINQPKATIFSRLFGAGVPPDAWSVADQERMANDQLPKNPPNHPNV